MTSLLESLGVMVHRRSRLALGMMVLCLLFATSASAAPGAPLQDRQRYVLTISGGVSLGAYEGGLLYYLMNHIGTRSPRSELAVVTGASAGSLNSLIAILSDCGLQREAPLDSLAYRVWQSVDLAGLAQPKDVTPISLFSRTAFSPAIAAIKQAWMGGIDTKCDVLLGVSVTRRTPIQHQIRPGLVVIRQAEYFVFRIQGRGKHQAPRISNAPPSDNAQAQLGLPFTGDDAGDFELLMQTLQASAAFPLAFKPQPLSYCVLTPQTGAGCARQNTATSEFIDGGVFDNTPLRLAESLARRRFPNKSDYNHLLFGVITAGGETHPDGAAALDQQQSLNQSPGLFSYLNELSRNLITTTRGREISTLLTEHPYLGDKLLINVHVLPPASHYYYAFSGFIDGGFREFDFALGMWEARFFVTRAAHEQIGQLGIQHKGPLMPSWGSNFDSPPWEIYRCIDQAAQSEQPAERVCRFSQAQSKRLLPLIDTTLDLVRARCSASGGQKSSFPSCGMLARKQVEIAPEADESDREYFFRSLQRRHYSYGNSDQVDGKQWLRERMQPVLHRFAQQQAVHEQVFVASGAEILLDRLSYAPPKEISYALVGTAITFGKSYSLIDDPNSMFSIGRWEFGSMVQGLDTFLGRSRDMLAVTPYLGMMVDLTSLVQIPLRPRVGLRAGYQGSSGDSWGNHPCTVDNNGSSSYACSQATLHPYLSLSLLDRLRFDVVYQIFPWDRSSKPGELSLMIGLQNLTY